MIKSADAEYGLTVTRLREILSYDRRTGIFRWRVKRSSRALPGQVAGTTNPKGYIVITIDYRHYFGHRLAWFYVYGKWPETELDHRNRRTSDNWIKNLREATRSGNIQNVGNQRKNCNHLTGCYWEKQTGKWRARITVNGVKTLLGAYRTTKEAHAAYMAAKRELHPFGEIAQQ